MNAVGIDVSKGKSMVAIMRPFGEIVSTPFEIKHTASDIRSLVELINSVEGESRIVMEHTGRYYEVLAHQLSEANLFVSAINPKLILDKKRAQGKPYYVVYMTAGANKFLRIYYGRVKEYLSSLSES